MWFLKYKRILPYLAILQSSTYNFETFATSCKHKVFENKCIAETIYFIMHTFFSTTVCQLFTLPWKHHCQSVTVSGRGKFQSTKQELNLGKLQIFSTADFFTFQLQFTLKSETLLYFLEEINQSEVYYVAYTLCIFTYTLSILNFIIKSKIPQLCCQQKSSFL